MTFEITCGNPFCGFVEREENEFLAKEKADEHHANTDHTDIEINKLEN